MKISTPSVRYEEYYYTSIRNVSVIVHDSLLKSRNYHMSKLKKK